MLEIVLLLQHWHNSKKKKKKKERKSRVYAYLPLAVIAMPGRREEEGKRNSNVHIIQSAYVITTYITYPAS